MKRFAVIVIFALGMISVSAQAEANHSFDSSKLKRAVADPNRTDFGSRANSIVGACDTSRPGTAAGAAAPDTGGLFQAQLPSGATGDLSSGGAAGAVLGGAGAAGNAAAGQSLFNSKCTSCHSKPPAAVIAVLQGKPLSAKAQAAMSGVLAGLSESDKASIIAFQKTL